MADVISVSALNKYVKSILESDPVLTDIAIRGEISNFSRNYKAGHCYFTLKDEKAGVKAVMFRGDAQDLSFAPENGMQVVARGRITLYERDGAFQIYVENLFLDGAGAAQQAFLQLKERLEKDGLFDPAHKRALPQWPKNIGLVTSKTGAALHDILQVAQRRYPLVSFILAPVSVQGQQAVPGIIKAVERLAQIPGVDFIIIARGGGSAEDLWVFNSEELARVVYSCAVPVVSAIGHEIDFTILDFVADLRAPTPSAAAEMALPDVRAIRQQLMNIRMNISNKMQTSMDLCYNRLSQSVVHMGHAAPNKRIEDCRQHVKQLALQVKKAQSQFHLACLSQFQANVSLAEGLSPYAVLARGYSVATHNSTVLRSVQGCHAGDKIVVSLLDGKIDGVIENVAEGRWMQP